MPAAMARGARGGARRRFAAPPPPTPGDDVRVWGVRACTVDLAVCEWAAVAADGRAAAAVARVCGGAVAAYLADGACAHSSFVVSWLRACSVARMCLERVYRAP